MERQEREQGAMLLRQVWIDGVNAFIEHPKPSWITPWDQMKEEGREWEQEILRFLWQNVAPIARRNTTLDREIGGQLIRDAWRLGVYALITDPKPAYVGPWSEMADWEQETDRRMWEAIVIAVHQEVTQESVH